MKAVPLLIVGGVGLSAATAVTGIAIGISAGIDACSGSTTTPSTSVTSTAPVATPSVSASSAAASPTDIAVADLTSLQLQGGTSNPTLWKAIGQTTNNKSRVVLSMLMGSYLESSYRNEAENGAARGPFQITSVDVVTDEAEDPVFAVNYMEPRYARAAKDPTVSSDALWQSDPEQAAEQVAVAAEIPGPSYYQLQGTAKVDAAYRSARSVMSWLGLQTSDFPALSSDSPSAGSGCSGGSSTDDSQTSVTVATGRYSEQRNAVLTAAVRMLGVKYSYAAGGYDGVSLGACSFGDGYNDCHVVGIDCSGLVMYAFHQAQVYDFPHLAADQYHLTSSYTVVPAGGDPSKAQPGDLVFFEGAADPGHVAIYIGNGRVIEAPHSGALVQYNTLSAMSPFTAITDPFAWRAAQRSA